MLPQAGAFTFGTPQSYRPMAGQQPYVQQPLFAQPVPHNANMTHSLPAAAPGPYQMGQTAPSKPQVAQYQQQVNPFTTTMGSLPMQRQPQQAANVTHVQEAQELPLTQSSGIPALTNGDHPDSKSIKTVPVPSQARATVAQYVPATSTPQSAAPPQLLQNNWGNVQLPMSNGTNGIAKSGEKTKEVLILEKKVADLEQQLRQKSGVIHSLQAELKKTAGKGAVCQKNMVRNPNLSGRNGLGSRESRETGESHEQLKPVIPYTALARTDPIDVRLEEFYNNTNSAVPFQRINKGWYKFGKTQVELEIINHKLMAKTDEGWNRGKYGDIEKFVITFEPIERERAGVPFD